MIRCVALIVFGCAVTGAVGRPQHQYQTQQAPEVPPHLLRQYLADQGGHVPQQTQLLTRPAHIPGAAPAPARLPYAVQSEGQYQQPQQYQHQPQAQPQPQYRPQPQYQAPRAQKEPEDYDPHPSYQFGFDVSDDQFTNYQNRKEQRDGDVIKGSYSVVDSDGFIRTVSYTADPKEGFKAEVSRQPTDIVVKIPTPKPQTAQLQPQQYTQTQTQPQQFSQPQHQHQPQPQQYTQPQQYSQPQQAAHAPRPQAPQQYYRYEQ